MICAQLDCTAGPAPWRPVARPLPLGSSRVRLAAWVGLSAGLGGVALNGGFRGLSPWLPSLPWEVLAVVLVGAFLAGSPGWRACHVIEDAGCGRAEAVGPYFPLDPGPEVSVRVLRAGHVGGCRGGAGVFVVHAAAG